jgi:hypothetical protein
MPSIKKGIQLGQGLNLKTGEEVIMYSKKCKVQGGFISEGRQAIINNKLSIVNTLSIHGNRVLNLIRIYIASTKGTSCHICLSQKYVEQCILGESFPSGRVSLNKGIKELIDLKVIKKSDYLPRYYDINACWFPINSSDIQESF